MAYVPNNLQIFTAAYAGALAGMGASDRVPEDPNSANYVDLANVAGAFAQSFDTEWGVVPETLLDVESTQELCEVAWQDRAPQAKQPTLNPDNFSWSVNNSPSPSIDPNTYTKLSRALIAMIRAGGAYFGGQGITPPPVQLVGPPGPPGVPGIPGPPGPAGPAGPGPGGVNGETQYRIDANNFGGIEGHKRTNIGQENLQYWQMTGEPALTFAGNTITRGFGSWLTDAATGRFNIFGTLLNDGVKEVSTTTPPTALVLTTTTPVVAEVVGSSPLVRVEGGSTDTYGLATELESNRGVRRFRKLDGSAPIPDRVMDSFRNIADESIVAQAFSQFGDVSRGGTLTEYLSGPGVVVRPRKVLDFGKEAHDVRDRRWWEDDKGSFTTFLEEFRGRNEFNDALAHVIAIQGGTPVATPVAPFIELWISGNRGGIDSGVWYFKGTKVVGLAADWEVVQAGFPRLSAGAAAWLATVTGDPNLIFTVTGDVGPVPIVWKVYGRFI